MRARGDRIDPSDLTLSPKFKTKTIHRSAILAATNAIGDEWNEFVQNMNPEESVTCFSSDHFDEVDDVHGNLRNMITTEVMSRFDESGCPSHQLKLKRNDICIVLRNLSKRNGVANNVRVRILHINFHSIVAETLTEPVRQFVLPRIRFKIGLKYIKGYKFMRTQFPLRLAYCLTLNKSQAQTFGKSAFDIRHPPFSHGHAYVAMSRVRESKDLMLFCNKNQICEDISGDKGVLLTNVVYKKLLLDSDMFT